MVLCNHRPKACPERGGGFRVSESRRGYKLARSSLLVSTPQSRLTPCQLPVRGAFWFVQPPTQKPALKGEVAMSDSELTEGLHRGCSFFPQPLSRLAATAPRPGSLLALCNSAQKPAPKGEVAMSDSELTEGLHRSCSFFPSTPQSPVGDSSPSGEPYVIPVSLTSSARSRQARRRPRRS